MSAIAVIDSNVLVAGLLTRQADSPTAKIVDGMLSAQFTFAVSVELIAEYHRVLRYPKVARLHGLSDTGIDDLLTELVVPATVVEPARRSFEVPDPGDVFLFELLAALSDGVLVTGDRLLLEDGPDWARVVEPADFIREARLP